MFSVGDKIIYGENGVCTVADIGSLPMDGAGGRVYYHLTHNLFYFVVIEKHAIESPMASMLK